MKFDKNITSFLREVKYEGKEIFDKGKEFIQAHKKIILTGIVLYVVYRIFFEEEK